MAIVKMKEFNLFAFDAKKDELLRELQRFEYVHLQDLRDVEQIKELELEEATPSDSLATVEEDIYQVNAAIGVLSKYHIKETGLKAMEKGLENHSFQSLESKAHSINHQKIYTEVLDVWKERERINSTIERIKASINEFQPWAELDYPISDIKSSDKVSIMVGTVPKKLKDRLFEEAKPLEYTHMEIIYEDKDTLYVLVLSHPAEDLELKEVLRSSNFSNVSLKGEAKPKDEIKRLETRIRNHKLKLEEEEKKLQNMSNELPKLEIAYDYLTNKRLRAEAATNFMKTEKVDLINGFIPEDKEAEFVRRIKNAVDDVYYLEIKYADKDDPRTPVMLKNSGFSRHFEALTAMYALPRYNEIDPTPFLAPFYLAFFGMMAADVGYGILMLIATFVVLKRFNLSDKTKSFVKFFYFLSFSVIIWGFIYGSFFGGIIPIKGLVDPATDYNTLLILSIIFGLIHIFFALGIKAYVLIRDGKALDALYDVGFWYAALIGGIGFLLAMIIEIPPTLKTIFMWVMIVGMVGIVATGGREAKGVFGKLGAGVYSLYGISGYIGDFVSYSRLMALGLAGGFIAGAVNMMAGMVLENGIVFLPFAALIFILGQVFNLGLTLLGAYVHTIRLTFVEFFGKFYEGGGKGFSKLQSDPKYINLK